MHFNKWIIAATIVVLLLLANFARSEGREGQEGQKPASSSVEDELRKRDEIISRRAKTIEEEKAIKKLEEELRKNETDAHKKARKEQEKEEKRAVKQKGREETAIHSVDLRGCREESEMADLWVNPAVGNERELRSSSVYSSFTVTIVNEGQVPISIRSTRHGELIRDMCSGGRLDLIFTATYETPQSLDFQLVAVGQSLGSGTLSESINVSLHHVDNYRDRRQEGRVWTLNLYRYR